MTALKCLHHWAINTELFEEIARKDFTIKFIGLPRYLRAFPPTKLSLHHEGSNVEHLLG